MASPRKPKSAGKKPARSDAEWWSLRRVEAFEALRDGKTPDVPPRTLRGWQKSPIWQARLAERDAALSAAAQAAELAPLERLRSYLIGAVDTVGQMATGKLEPCKTRLAAARFIVERFRVEPPQDGEDARILAILQVLTEDV